jgi:hypothetical protein
VIFFIFLPPPNIKPTPTSPQEVGKVKETWMTKGTREQQSARWANSKDGSSCGLCHSIVSSAGLQKWCWNDLFHSFPRTTLTFLSSLLLIPFQLVKTWYRQGLFDLSLSHSPQSLPCVCVASDCAC